MIPVKVDDKIPRALVDVLEFHARRLGVSLTALERIGMKQDLVERFIVACESGVGISFARAIEYGEEPPSLAHYAALEARATGVAA